MDYRYLALLAVLLTGCTSIRSTMLNRMEDNSFYGNSNGNHKEHCQPRTFEGVPITIKVPTHVDVKVMETYYLYPTHEGVKELRLNHRCLAVDTEFVFTEKVFTVDFKRPLSGSLEYAATLGDDQYFDTITTSLEDTTITDITALIAATAPLLSKPTSAVVGQRIKDDIIVNTRTVAFQRFDIDAADFEDQMRAFLQEHLNCCHSCEGDPRSNLEGTNLPVKTADELSAAGAARSQEATPQSSTPTTDEGDALQPVPRPASQPPPAPLQPD